MSSRIEVDVTNTAVYATQNTVGNIKWPIRSHVFINYSINISIRSKCLNKKIHSTHRTLIVLDH
jgi:hypothetical protein